MARRRKSSKSRRAGRRRGPPTIRTVIAVLLLLLVGYLIQQGYIEIDLEQLGEVEDLEDLGDLIEVAPVTSEPPDPLVYEDGTGSIQAFFTTPWLVYPDEPERRTPPPHETALIADIDAAQQQVDVAVFEYNLRGIADALIRAVERGVAVRLALDRENLEKPEMAEWAGRLEAAGIPIAWEDSTAFLHSKFVIIDNALVWMGSWNMTINGTYRNNNNLLRITIQRVVANYAIEFEQMFAGTFGNDKESLSPYPLIQVGTVTIENYFSPQDRPAPRLVEWLAGAQSSIHFLAFSFTSDEIAQAMVDRHAAGVTVQGVFETRNAGGIGAEFDTLQSQGIAVLDDGNCYTMHHKVIIIDERTVITGSYNFTKRAEETNDENLLIVDDPTLAGQFMEEFERVYEQAQHPTQCGR